MKAEVMTGWVKATGYAIAIHRATHGALKRKGIAKEMSYKERSEKIKEFNAWLLEAMQKHNIHRADVVKIYFEVEGDEKNFEILKNTVKVFVARPIGIIEGEDFKEVSEEEFEDIYYSLVEKVTGEKKKPKKREDKNGKLDVFLKKEDVEEV